MTMRQTSRHRARCTAASDGNIRRRPQASGSTRSWLITVLSLLLFLTPALSAQAQAESCPADGVPVGMKGLMCAFGGFSITLAGVTTTGSGNQCDGVIDPTPKVWPKLIPDKTYTLSAGSAICITTINFDVPEGYTLEIDGKEANQIRKQDAVGNVYSGDGTWQIVLRKKCPCDDGSSMGTNLGSVVWETGMGNLTDGRSAERISIREKVLSSTIYTPAALIYSPPGLTNEVDVVRNADGSLRQVKASQMLADVVVISASEYEIRYYRPTDVGAKVSGIYTLTGQPFLTWKIKNPDPSSVSKLQISKTQNSVTETSEYTWDAVVDAWSLTTGGGARVETKTISYPSPNSRTETFTVKDNTGQVASKTAKTYQFFEWGEELVREVADPDGAALVTTYTYYENPSQEWAYRKLKSVIHPDGSWEKYEYDSYWNKSLVLRPWKDVTLEAATIANARATVYLYTNTDGYDVFWYNKYLEATEERVEGKVVRATWITRGNAIQNPDGSTTQVFVDGHPVVLEEQRAYASLPVRQLTTTVRYHSSLRGGGSAPDFLANRVAWVVYPDGRKDSYSYEKGNYVANADPALSQFTPDANGLGERETVVHGKTPGDYLLPAIEVAFKTTKETIVRDQYGNQVLQETFVYNGTGYERTGWVVSVYDDRGQVVQTTRHNGQVSTTLWDGDRKTSEIDESGVETVYTYDSLGRVRTRTKKGVAAGGGFAAQSDITTTLTYDAEGRTLSESMSGGGPSLPKSRTYDKAGRVKSETDETGLVTTYTYADWGRKMTVTRPGGATAITENYLDGQTKSVTGTAVVAQYFDYGVDFTTITDGTQYTKVLVGSAGLSSPRWTKTNTDWLGRTIKVEKPGFTGTSLIQTSAYNNKGQLIKEATAAGGNRALADRLYEYDELGQQIRAGSDINADGALTLVSTDRISDTDTIFEKVGTDWFRVTSNRNYLSDNNDTPVIQVQRERLNNFPLNGTDQTVSDVSVTDIAGNNTRTTAAVDRAAKKQTTTTDTPDSNLNGVVITVNGLLQSSTPTTPQSATTYAYDSLGRQTGVTDPRTGTTTRSYSTTTGQLTATNDGAGTTSYEYHSATHVSAGRLKTQTNAVGKEVYFNYNNRGEMIQTWGDATYPLEYVYDSYGQRTELHTFRAGQSWAASVWPSSTTGTADVTRWFYQESTGLLTQRQDAALKGPTYAYDELGRMKTRHWSRGITCTYGYDANTGELRTVTYSDSTPAATFTYDRGGRQTNVTDAAGSHTRTFNVTGEMQTEQITGGVLDGVSINVGYDGFLRRNSLQTSHSTTTLSSQSYGYDSTSRLDTITSGSQTVTYGYYPNSGLPNTTSFTGGTNIARTYDPLGRLQSITTTPAADVAQSYTYTHNNLNQRTRMTREDGSYWSYIYNDRGGLISGKKYWSDNAVVWGAQTEYNFDNLGNRNYAKSGGNQVGSLRQSNYTTNSLNQYSQRSVLGAVDVTGTANTAATVTVNSQTTARKADYYYKELAVDNSAAPAYAQINVVGARNNFGAGGEDAVTEKGGRVFVPQAVETFTYDDDGNLTSDGRWNYTWDAENRLVSLEARAGVPAEAKQRLEFAYDYMARRIHKKVYVWNTGSSSYQLQSTLKFVYEGWILNAELDGANARVRSYVWGQDISGTLQDAGGIGGLLTIEEGGNSYFVGYDGNGNVAAAVNASTGKADASYEYDAFGNTLKATGEYAQRNPVRFSTKYTDGETGLVYFGYRYYEPQTGRWVGRDPIEEQGGINLYAYVTNNPVSFTDLLGLWEPDAHEAIIRQSFPRCLTGEQVQQLIDASKHVDRIWGQQEALSNEHGMRAGPTQSVEDARAGANAFMSGHLEKARALAPDGCKKGYDKIPWNAIWEFGQALHTITDMTSPRHEGFQIWYGPPLPTNGYPEDLFYSIKLLKWAGYAKWHADGETLGVLGSDTGRLNRIKETARKAFTDTFGKNECCKFE